MNRSFSVQLIYRSQNEGDWTGVCVVVAELVFGANVSRQDVGIEILYDTIKEMREVFTVHLKHRSGTAAVKVNRGGLLGFP